ncbi:uncharacterized protein [Aegilops tauschii subsp. strangulata]|uniref:uncharacterized protein n=1 Tax=Aegilops tauschii subsp. strangulata TaxID=200361 RepID=UPI003CC8D592
MACGIANPPPTPLAPLSLWPLSLPRQIHLAPHLTRRPPREHAAVRPRPLHRPRPTSSAPLPTCALALPLALSDLSSPPEPGKPRRRRPVSSHPPPDHRRRSHPQAEGGRCFPAVAAEQGRVCHLVGAAHRVLAAGKVLVRVAADPGGDCTGSAIAKEPHSTGSTSSSSSGRQRLPQLRPPQLWSPLHLCLLLRLPEMPSYVVYKGKVPGVYDDWEECRR